MNADSESSKTTQNEHNKIESKNENEIKGDDLNKQIEESKEKTKNSKRAILLFLSIIASGLCCIALALGLGIGLATQIKASKYNSSCSTNSTCSGVSELTCLNSLCVCSSNDYYWNGIACATKKSYTMSCLASSECNDAAGLICPSTSGTCNCPVTLSTIFCDCPIGYFYDYTNNSCSNNEEPLLLYDFNCTYDYQCKSSVLLTCQNGTCKCPSLPGWFWSSTALKCLVCPANWTIFGDHCYKLFNNLADWNTAMSNCQNLNSTLMIIRNQAEYNLLQSFYTSLNNPALSIWVGAVSKVYMMWYWVYDNSTLATNSTFWCPGEPNNTGGNTTYVAAGGNTTYVAEGCAMMWTGANSQICFNDFSCYGKEFYVCEKVN